MLVTLSLSLSLSVSLSLSLLQAKQTKQPKNNQLMTVTNQNQTGQTNQPTRPQPRNVRSLHDEGLAHQTSRRPSPAVDVDVSGIGGSNRTVDRRRRHHRRRRHPQWQELHPQILSMVHPTNHQHPFQNHNGTGSQTSSDYIPPDRLLMQTSVLSHIIRVFSFQTKIRSEGSLPQIGSRQRPWPGSMAAIIIYMLGLSKLT